MRQDTIQGSSPKRSNPAGIASLIAGVVMVGVAVAVQSLSAMMPVLHVRFELPIWLLGPLTIAPTALIAVIAVILGLVGLLQRERGRTAAIIGTTLGASQLIVLILGAIGRGLVVAVVG